MISKRQELISRYVSGGASLVDAARRGGRRGGLLRRAVAGHAGRRGLAPLRLPRQLPAQRTLRHARGAQVIRSRAII